MKRERGFVLRRVAEQEFDDSIAWYDCEREGLGREFRRVIEQYFQIIAADPERFPIVRGRVRRAVVLQRFHFVIHFLIEPDRIVILSVFHPSRDPEQLKKRR
jgi:plasmid stabilization system protein ParE